MQTEAHPDLEVRPNFFQHLLHFTIFKNMPILVQFSDYFQETKNRAVSYDLILYAYLLIIIVILNVHLLYFISIREFPDA